MTRFSQTGFTNKEICRDTNKLIWYEYCPSNKQEFKQILDALVFQKQMRSDTKTIKTINDILIKVGSSTRPLQEYSNTDQWLDAYWALYLESQIVIGYAKQGRVGPKIFSVQKPTQRYLM